jgi:hypothetical protein
MGNTYLIHTVLFSSLLISSAVGSNLWFRNRNPLVGHNQQETIDLWEKIIEGSGYGDRNKYNERFRPPTVTSDGSPAPTVVEFSLRDFRVKKFNETGGTLKFTVNIVREYEDSRLAFEPPKETIKFTRVPKYQTVWQPNTAATDTTNFYNDYGNALEPSYDDTTFVTPEGRIYQRKSVQVELMALEGDDIYSSRKEFRLTLAETENSIEDVLFKWREQELFVFGEDGKTYKTESGQKYTVKPKMESCKRLEHYGSFVGSYEVTCIRLGLTLVPI